ncbi:MAG TPA: DUF177 domain-containing protein [Chloroflexi bacterium]|nr:DUF177 domain-containing protein [Chloroflexota bacterium]
MRFNVAQLLKRATGSSRRYQMREGIEGIDPGLTIREPLVGQIEMVRTADGILVRGELTTAVELQCDRCLEPFIQKVEFEIEEEFHPAIDMGTGGQPPYDEEETRIDEHHILDLTELIRQSIFLTLPMHPVCRLDCLGFCGRCGQNLNEGPCGCEEPEVDPRLETLRKLL